MNINEIENILMNTLELDEAHVSGDGSHFQIIAVSEQFAGMSRLKKQQTIYTTLIDCILDKRIHALSIKAYTPDEWQHHYKLNSF